MSSSSPCWESTAIDFFVFPFRQGWFLAAVQLGALLTVAFVVASAVASVLATAAVAGSAGLGRLRTWVVVAGAGPVVVVVPWVGRLYGEQGDMEIPSGALVGHQCGRLGRVAVGLVGLFVAAELG